MTEEGTPCERLGHDYEFLGRRLDEGSRPGHLVDEFYCRRCLHTEFKTPDENRERWLTPRTRP